MSPDLGRFIQPDPIGFKGDASNLYRYCGNDWANRSDPMGLESVEPHLIMNTKEQQAYRDWNSDHVRGAIMSALFGITRMQIRDPVKDMGFTTGGTNAVVTGQGGSSAGHSQGSAKNTEASKIDPQIVKEGMKATDDSVRKMESTGIPHSEVSYTDSSGRQSFTNPVPGKQIGEVMGRPIYEERVSYPEGATPRIVGHSHLPGASAFSNRRGGDVEIGARIPVMKNLDGHRGSYDLYYRGWRSHLNPNGEIMGHPFQYP